MFMFVAARTFSKYTTIYDGVFKLREKLPKFADIRVLLYDSI